MPAYKVDTVVKEYIQSPIYKHILVALDGSADSLAGGDLALQIARNSGAAIKAVHVYDTKIHNTRFKEMEPGLPPQYRAQETLGKLRREHDTLMSEGFKALSLGYMEDFVTRAEQQGVDIYGAALEGRNYIGLLAELENDAFDLIVLGATGLGGQGDGMIGSTALRVLRQAHCDVLVARSQAVTENNQNPVLACTDGSSWASAALQRGAFLAGSFGRQLHLFAAYDVDFHRRIFKTMARSLSSDRQQEIGLDRQEAVHEELIDKSLESLYGSYLQTGAGEVKFPQEQIHTCLKPGKAYRAIVEYAGETGTDLVVLGRYGHNYEPVSAIGSHAEAVARLASCHVLICSGQADESKKSDGLEEISWEEDALKRLQRIPAHVRPMAKKAIEQQVIAAGENKVTLHVYEKVAGKFGMG